MKRLLTTAALSAIVASSAFAQSYNKMEAFHNVGVGIEAGLMGAGIEVSMPVVSDHLVLVLGYNLPKLTIGTDFDVSSSELRSKIHELNANIDRYNAQASNMPGYSRIDNLDCPNSDINVDVDAKVNFGAFKAMIEYYPSARSGFHLTAGMFVGQEDFISLNGTADDAWWQVYQKALSINKQLPSDMRIRDIENSVKFNIDEQTFQLKENSGGKVDVSVATKKVKPYFGIGFGRAIPKKRVGFQFELGAWMHGKPTIKSASEVSYDAEADGIDGVSDVMSKVQFWPQMTFRLTGRIL